MNQSYELRYFDYLPFYRLENWCAQSFSNAKYLMVIGMS